MYSGGEWHAAALVVREDLRPGDAIAGPAIIAERNATTVVEPGWQARLTALEWTPETAEEVRIARLMDELRRLDGAQLAAVVALHDRDELQPQPDRAPAEAGASGRLRAADNLHVCGRP